MKRIAMLCLLIPLALILFACTLKTVEPEMPMQPAVETTEVPEVPEVPEVTVEPEPEPEPGPQWAVSPAESRTEAGITLDAYPLRIYEADGTFLLQLSEFAAAAEAAFVQEMAEDGTASCTLTVGETVRSWSAEPTFEPDAAQTRAMMVTVLYRVEGEPAVPR